MSSKLFVLIFGPITFILVAVLLIRDYRAMTRRHKAIKEAFDKYIDLDSKTDAVFYSYIRLITRKERANPIEVEWHKNEYERLKQDTRDAWNHFKSLRR